jgi:P27 family predicted phage terminase small subunit
MSEPTPLRPEMPDCPAWLDGLGRETWQTIAADLWREGNLDPVTSPLLAAYCASYAAFAAASVTARRDGYSLRRGQWLVAHPAVRAADLAAKEMRRLGSLLGLTPLARWRLRAKRAGKGATG